MPTIKGFSSKTDMKKMLSELVFKPAVPFVPKDGPGEVVPVAKEVVKEQPKKVVVDPKKKPK